MRLFFEIFWIAPKGPPSFVSIFCNTMDVKKSQIVPPFTFFGTVTLFKNHISQKNFWEIFQSQRVPPFTILSLRYGADFGRSRLVFKNGDFYSSDFFKGVWTLHYVQ